MKKLKIDLSELAMAYETSDFEINHFLDLETGSVVIVTEDSASARDEFLEEVELKEDDDVNAKINEWLETYDCPEWQNDFIRDAILVELGFGDRFIRVPKQESRDGYNDMAEFAETVQDKRLQDLLSVALNGKGAFRRFKDVLLDYPEERERWFKFKEEQVNRRILEWLESEEIEIEVEE